MIICLAYLFDGLSKNYLLRQYIPVNSYRSENDKLRTRCAIKLLTAGGGAIIYNVKSYGNAIIQMVGSYLQILEAIAKNQGRGS